MQWLISKDPIRLALVITMWNLIIGVVVAIIQSFLKIDSASAASGIIAIFIVGAGYAQKYNEEMAVELRKKVAAFFSLIQYIFAFFAYYVIKVDIPMIGWLLIISVITAVLYLLSSWLLGFSGRVILKNKKSKS